MKRDSRLSAALHAMLHMADRKAPMTSEELAMCLHTNPVVVRRTMAGLREAGLVASGRGHGGGWTLARDTTSISLCDVYLALGEPILIHQSTQTESPGCVVEQAVNGALDAAFRDAQALLVERFERLMLSDLAAAFSQRVRLHADQTKGRGDAA